VIFQRLRPTSPIFPFPLMIWATFSKFTVVYFPIFMMGLVRFALLTSQRATRVFAALLESRPEAAKIFNIMARKDWFEGWERSALIDTVAELFGDLNMIHPFREGNGRAQRVLFEHIIVNAGFTISWWPVEEAEWIRANVAAVICDYGH